LVWSKLLFALFFIVLGAGRNPTLPSTEMHKTHPKCKRLLHLASQS